MYVKYEHKRDVSTVQLALKVASGALLKSTCQNKLGFHGADTDTDTDTDTDILADFRARIVHESDMHEDPRRLVRHAARFSSR